MSDRLMICKEPGCQTPAGCKCGYELYEVQRWPHTAYSEIVALRIRIAALTAKLDEAREERDAYKLRSEICYSGDDLAAARQWALVQAEVIARERSEQHYAIVAQSPAGQHTPSRNFAADELDSIADNIAALASPKQEKGD